MSPILCYVGPGGLCLSTSQSVIAWNVSRSEAFAILSRIEGIDPDEVLNTNVDAIAFKATVSSALAAETIYLSATIDSMEATSAVERLHGRLDLLLQVTEELRGEQARANDIATAQMAERQLAAERAEREYRERVAREEKAKQARLAAEAERLKKMRQLRRWADGSADFVDIGAKPNIVLRHFKPGEPIPPEIEAFA